MDQSFRDEMTAGYALSEPSLIIGSPMLDGELDNDAHVQVALSMMNRHGLIAGATGTGKTKTLQLLAGQLPRPACRLHLRHQGRRDRGSARRATPTNPKVIERAPRSTGLRAVRPPGRVPLAVGQAGRAGPGQRPFVRAAAAGQGARPQRHPDRDPVADLQVLRRQPRCRCSISRTSRRR